MKRKQYIVFFLIVAVLAALDQLIKYLIVQNFALSEEKRVFGNFLVLTYIRNEGTAWGIFAGKLVFLLILTAVITTLILYVFHNIAGYVKKYRIIRILLACLMGGALGNLIDRIRLHYVVDYIYVKIIHFPVFNFADIFVTCSVILLVTLIIFYYKVEDFDVLIGEKVYKEDGTYEEKRSDGNR